MKVKKAMTVVTLSADEFTQLIAPKLNEALNDATAQVGKIQVVFKSEKIGTKPDGKPQYKRTNQIARVKIWTA